MVRQPKSGHYTNSNKQAGLNSVNEVHKERVQNQYNQHVTWLSSSAHEENYIKLHTLNVFYKSLDALHVHGAHSVHVWTAELVWVVVHGHPREPGSATGEQTMHFVMETLSVH